MSSAVTLWSVPVIVGAEILNNLSRVINLPKACSALKFIPTKSCEEFIFNKTVTVYRSMSYFNNLFR
jgi:hypothetical protein